jgi:hypothetical protein
VIWVEFFFPFCRCHSLPPPQSPLHQSNPCHLSTTPPPILIVLPYTHNTPSDPLPFPLFSNFSPLLTPIQISTQYPHYSDPLQPVSISTTQKVENAPWPTHIANTLSNGRTLRRAVDTISMILGMRCRQGLGRALGRIGHKIDRGDWGAQWPS